MPDIQARVVRRRIFRTESHVKNAKKRKTTGSRGGNLEIC